ncbi:hypothetical protein U472_05400 [Orenia metallireducens]|jgi:hypothetical protein|uniref:Uncharacterized protein n=1 Tax=Orenia metallireducens TaxID=1413210 RepID=A0A1C0A9G1_9FIRM|nr:hypothetical protein [Orenia metallireducens]OCL26924.1 hypothetical protein U472_05400 [Orenia metallireducens]
MHTCPLLFIANKSLIKKEANLDKILYNSSCLKEECVWFDNNTNSCTIKNNPNKSYIQKTLGCI